MTGFGSGSATGPDLSIRVELRSVNAKGLNIKVRVGQRAATLESQVEAALRERLSRGSVTATVELTPRVGTSSLALDAEEARGILDQLKDLSRETGLEPPRVEALLSIPSLLGDRLESIEESSLRAPLAEAVQQALDALVESRRREGASLEADLCSHLGELRATAAEAGRRMPQVQAAHLEALRERVARLLGQDTPVPEADLAREVALLADKLDVSEELSRLEAHLGHFEGLLNEDGPRGRSLDFLTQELNREANTLGSKCNDAGVAHLVVQMKGTIERLREQIQNVE